MDSEQHKCQNEINIKTNKSKELKTQSQMKKGLQQSQFQNQKPHVTIPNMEDTTPREIIPT